MSHTVSQTAPAPITTSGQLPHTSAEGGGLPRSRSRWPAEAVTSHRLLLRELDAWCREHGWSPTANAAVAEEAVRQAWR